MCMFYYSFLGSIIFFLDLTIYCLFTFTLFTNIGVKQAHILDSDGVRQLNNVHQAFISYNLQESMGTYH
jgi:hypothetical protein